MIYDIKLFVENCQLTIISQKNIQVFLCLHLQVPLSSWYMLNQHYLPTPSHFRIVCNRSSKIRNSYSEQQQSQLEQSKIKAGTKHPTQSPQEQEVTDFVSYYH